MSVDVKSTMSESIVSSSSNPSTWPSLWICNLVLTEAASTATTQRWSSLFPNNSFNCFIDSNEPFKISPPIPYFDLYFDFIFRQVRGVGKPKN